MDQTIPPQSDRQRGELIGLKVRFDGDDPAIRKFRTIVGISDNLFMNESFLAEKGVLSSRLFCLVHHTSCKSLPSVV